MKVGRQRLLGQRLPVALFALALLLMGTALLLPWMVGLEGPPYPGGIGRFGRNALMVGGASCFLVAIVLRRRFQPGSGGRTFPPQERWQLWLSASILLVASATFLWGSARLFAMRSQVDPTAMDLGALAATMAFGGIAFLVAAALFFHRGRSRG